MDFDLSKENIQPLRGGRNATQLEVAIQAQTNQELQKHLQLQKEHFETLIRNYNGDDPLENWYNYIYWTVQSFPKHGHEGNLITLLEHCLARFENDKRYTHDRRFCKLWIKYIDLQQNPLELYQMMYARGLSRGCADLYRAWAYYYEAAGDFRSANYVYECGLRELAQPHDELVTSHHHLIMAAGQHMVYGRNEQALLEKRQALTSLQTYKSGQVSNIRTAIETEPTIATVATTSSSRSNIGIQIFEDNDENEIRAFAIPPTSIVKAAKRDEVPKENTIKPGTWIKPYAKKSAASGGSSGFTVHEDGSDVKVPQKFPPHTLETFTDWIVSLTLPEPKDDRMIPMYPKQRVYADIGTEYSLEELRSRKYIIKKPIKQDSANSSSMLFCMETSEEQPPPFAVSSPNKRFTLGPNFNKSESHFVNKNSSTENAEFEIWRSPNVSQFVVYEEDCISSPSQPMPKPKGTPLNDPIAAELAETGSRGGIADAAPVDAAKNLPVFEIDDDDDDISPQPSANLTCNTQTFNFNLNAMKVSTPQSKMKSMANFDNNSKISSKQLFSETSTIRLDEKPDKFLSTIKEESNYGQSSSSGSSCGTKSSLLNNYAKQKNMSDISEEHHNNLAQNLMANAALRSSLLGNLMDLNTPANLSINVQEPPATIVEKKIPSPVIVSPINYIPSDPFKPRLIRQLLEKVCFPGPHTRDYFQVNNIPRLMVRKESINISHDKYVIEKQLGKGTYGTVFRAVDLKNGQSVALKYQKPANEWEFYICRELRSRLVDHYLRDRFMDVRVGYFSDQASVLVSEFMPCGSLLDVAKTIKQKSGRSMKESLCIYFCIEMLKVVQAMHSVKIIHADIKPDNFLVELLPDNTVGLQLIDFGCSIDMSLFPPDTSFTRRITTENFISCEMLDGRPWNYHTDMFCIAATAHVLLFEKYLLMQKNGRLWSIQQHIPRYLRSSLWNEFFSTLLNQQQGAADSESLQALLDENLKRKSDDFHTDMRFLLNILRNR